MSTQQPITSVFVLMLENHSFDNLFACSGISGIIAATSANSNVYNGTTYPVRCGAPASMPTDPGHEFQDVVTQLAGPGSPYPRGGPYPAINNSGFAASYATTTTEGSAPLAADIGDIMACFQTGAQLPVTYQLATQFALCDQWFSSMPGPTWPNRFFVHGASSAGLDHGPTALEIIEWETVSGFRYPNGSLYDALTAAGIPYGLFHDTNGPLSGSIPQVASLHNIYLTDVGSIDELKAELQGNYRYRYTFIEPNYGNLAAGTYESGSSQHPMDSVAGGEQLIRTVYEAIRNSSIWERSLLIIVYDEHGGFYDHCAPPTAVPPGDGSSGKYNKYGFDFTQLGVRVPAVIVSPWITRGTIDHTRYDHSSVLATAEALFGLPPLTRRDAGANNLLHLLSSTLRTDCPTTLARPALGGTPPGMTAALRTLPDQHPLPGSGNFHGFLSIALKTELELTSGSSAERAACLANFRSIRTMGQARHYIAAVMGRAAAVRAGRR
jgi:phospholipase C